MAIDSSDGLLSNRRQVITWTNDGPGLSVSMSVVVWNGVVQDPVSGHSCSTVTYIIGKADIVGILS